jgi:hypothetical protein
LYIAASAAIKMIIFSKEVQELREEQGAEENIWIDER